MALTYVQDCYQYVRQVPSIPFSHLLLLRALTNTSQILGDALVGVVFVRNAISTCLIFAVPPWMTNMGIYDMFVVCGVLAAVIALTCVPLIIWGRQFRERLAGRYLKYQERQY
jgi:hypothetical protein